MSIDEAIAHAREVAEEQRKDNDNCKYKSQYGCKDCADYYCKPCIECADYYSKPCIECAKEHEQLAEWLEDYKRIKMLIPIEQALKNEYNKAIDDFKKMLTIEKIKEYAESDGFINLNNCSLMIFDIAEKLKVGGKNG